MTIEFTPPFKALVDGVAAYFTANGVTAVVARGPKARFENINQGPGRANRVVFLGSNASGAAGKFVKPRQPGICSVGGDPTTDPPTPPDYQWRPLCDWQRTFQVSIWAYDGTNRNDEGAQDDALYQLVSWTMRAVNSVAFGNADFGASNITVPETRGFGLEMLVDLTIQHAMPDLPLDLAFPDALVNRPTP